MGGMQCGIAHICGSALLAASLTFGRDSAQYWRLVEILAMVSIALWSLVLLTTICRLGARFVWYRSRREQNREAPPRAVSEL